MTTAEQLAARRRATAGSRRRRGPRTLPGLPAPSGVVTAYTAVLLAIVSEMNEATARALDELGVPVRLDAQGDVPDFAVTPAQAARVRARLEALAERIAARRSVVSTIGTIVGRVAQHGRASWAAQVKAAIGVDLSDDVDLTARAKVFRRENVNLIKSLTSEHVERVHRVLIEGQGSRVEVIAKRIQEATGASKSRAALIARDQVLSLNSEVTEARHKAAGVTEYVWRASTDERVRKRHKELDGTRQKYSEPPIVDKATGRRAHPGQDFQCRCTADPVIEGFDD